MTTADKASETKTCKLCGCAIIRGDRGSYEWNRIRVCSCRCAALYRGKLMGDWKNSSKTCAMCGVVFHPRPGIPKGEWRKLKCCSEECSNRSGRGYKVRKTPINPANCRTIGERIRFLRLSKSPCGKKTPWSVRYMAQLTGCCDNTIENVEAGNTVIVPGVVGMICEALKVDPDWLVWSEKKWTRIISAANLTATELVKIKPNNNESN